MNKIDDGGSTSQGNTAGSVQGSYPDLALHTLGWKAFQDLCAQVCAEVLQKTVSIYREAQDGGQDAVFLAQSGNAMVASIEATVQCKFSSKADKRLRPSDLKSEMETVSELVAKGQAKIYYLITSQGVDAPVALAIKEQLLALGVQEAEVLGREWLTLQIRSSVKLRALVPRIYGLGDLSIILDERQAAQTQALLGHLKSSLRTYVPTAAHRSAVNVLSEHGLVLLIGNPAAGKSMLAAILATTAMDDASHQAFKCEGPLELISRWNPHERGRLYWIDDAFGANQTRTDYVDAWISAMPLVKAALEDGNRFILTSRTHVWNGALPRLGTRNHPLFANRRAVVDVGALSPEERQEIVYNHMKAGQQPKDWKVWVKRSLPDVAALPTLLPEIARRLADPSYTAGIQSLPKDLLGFVAEPADFLKQTISELGTSQQAALTLVFLWRSSLPDRSVGSAENLLVATKYGVSVSDIVEALRQLEGSFVVRRHDNGEASWGFVHPTFTDAISSLLSDRPDLVELYVQGSRLETLLSEVVCEGAAPIRDAVVVPKSTFDLLVNRLQQTPQTPEFNRPLFEFLAHRASTEVLTSLVKSGDKLLRRPLETAWRVRRNPRIRLLARLKTLGLLDPGLRAEAADELERAAFHDYDLSFMGDDGLLELIEPTKLLLLGRRLAALLEDDIPRRIVHLEQQADPDSFVPDEFDEPRSFVEQLREVFGDEDWITDRLDEIDNQIEQAIEDVKGRKTDEDDDVSFWSDVKPAVVTKADGARSIFSDVDE
jgi:hypothetical protein